MVELDFLLNNQPMSKLKGMGLSMDAFSGMDKHVNHCAAACLRNIGPIPPGAYYIVDRPTGGLLGSVNTWIKKRSGWFGLFGIDSKIDDFVFCSDVERGNFRLHPKGPLGISEGCITVERENDFLYLRQQLLRNPAQPIPGTRLMAYGKVVVRCGRQGA